MHPAVVCVKGGLSQIQSHLKICHTIITPFLCVLQFVLLFKSINVELDDITTACMECIREMTNPEKVLQHNYKHALTIVIDKFNI